MKTALVGLLLVGLALASPIVVRQGRSLYGHGLVLPGLTAHGLLAPSVVAPGLVAPGLVAPASLHGSLAAIAHSFPGSVLSGHGIPYTAPLGAVPAALPLPAPAVVEPDYEDSYDDGSYKEADLVAAPVAAPALVGPGAEVAPATFPDIEPTTPTPKLEGPTLDGPVVPPLIIKGPSGTIKTGPLSTGAVSLAGHVSDKVVH